MKDLPPWDDDVLALLNSERRASSLSDERREQLLERVERSAAVMGAIAGLGGAGLVAGAALSKASWIERLTVTASGAKAAVAVAFVSGVVGRDRHSDGVEARATLRKSNELAAAIRCVEHTARRPTGGVLD